MDRIPGTEIQCETMTIPTQISAVYFLIKDGKVMYVGQTKNLIGRLWVHKRFKDFDEVKFIRCEWRRLLEVEQYWIAYFDPPWRSNDIEKKYIYDRRFLPPVRLPFFKRHPLGESLTEANEL